MDRIDFSFDLNDQSWSLLHALAGRLSAEMLDVEDLNIGTYPWYNGRERGFLLTIRKGFWAPTLAFWFAEARSSDQIVIYSHAGDFNFLNPQDFTLDDDTWKGAQYFPCLRVDLAADHILERVSLFLA